ncbi:hypothetical protein Psi01_77790 [Planobispora siamensis]|uniref:Uncharacterized protein n=1 Tax=Planobispora siamensis TaxID=936338 RepID=A0A8J3SRN1_9ACTN|nr:hypothetical protein Psi01_77790 [Planobispora siamensis]
MPRGLVTPGQGSEPVMVNAWGKTGETPRQPARADPPGRFGELGSTERSAETFWTGKAARS